MLSSVAALRTVAPGSRSCLQLNGKLAAFSVRGMGMFSKDDTEEQDSMGLTTRNKTWGQGTLLDKLTAPKHGRWYYHPYYCGGIPGDTENLLRQYEPEIIPKMVAAEPSLTEHFRNWEAANDIFYGPDRDYKNFPVERLQEHPEKFNFFFIPHEIFKQMYPKLGVSGCYSVVASFLLFVTAKEFFAIGCAKNLKGIAMGLLIYYVTTKSPYIKTLFSDKARKEEEDTNYNIPLAMVRDDAKLVIENSEKEIWRQDAVQEIFAAKQETISLQLESQYRDRLLEAHREVKRKLDYMAEMDAAHRSVERSHMVNWIVDNVVKNITAQQEKESIANCIQTLKNLSKTTPL